ncbi:hypothetical protein SELMODRAFT_411781 [Selaginella moellendorffii]|uniref:Biotin carboxylase-like N-terminal domain-containing protein n=1 Tax=Selaginella moellendorffii TaxID=88036 RepID=D8RJ09_SELML|nr:hypothetical protein SELMODRAFT_411781 [Selaginella moellendorffii]
MFLLLSEELNSDRKISIQQARYPFSQVPPTEKSPIEKILIANRGKIACQIIKTAHSLGLKKVAVLLLEIRYTSVEPMKQCLSVQPTPLLQFSMLLIALEPIDLRNMKLSPSSSMVRKKRRASRHYWFNEYVTRSCTILVSGVESVLSCLRPNASCCSFFPCIEQVKIVMALEEKFKIQVEQQGAETVRDAADDAKFSTIGDLSGTDNDDEPKGFHKKGPEGWAGKVPLFPCHWYVHSLGFRAKYTFFSSDKNMVVHGDGFAHQEKNWGETFLAGHVWPQGMSRDNSSQIVCSGARFKLGKLLETTYVFSLGYRSANCKLDLRTNDLETIFKDVQLSLLEEKFALTGVGPSHTIMILCYASPVSFSEQILAPIGKLEWQPACRESFVATIEVEVFEHAVWGVASEGKLVDSQMFRCAALEFGEDLLEDALQQQDQSNPN